MRQITCGGDSCFILTDKQSVYSWGANLHSQLGYVSEPVSPEPTLVELSHPVDSISAGTHHAAALSGKTLYTWGANDRGQLGHQRPAIGELKLRVSRVSCGHDYTICLTENCELMLTGSLPFEVAGQDCLHKFE